MVAGTGAGPLDFSAHWRRWVLFAWTVAAILLLWDRWDFIRWFALGDTDDNMRIMQVRAWLDGQGWFDLRQHRLDPPVGADIHWSRLVDLPIAAIYFLARPLLDGPDAQRAAVALAPLLPMLVGMVSVAIVARRMISANAFLVAVALLLCAHSTRGMWVPLRIDHHGWQLGLMSLAMVGLTDPRRARGGALIGAVSALSLAIGLELLVYLAATGAILVLFWIRDRDEAPRLAAYGASLAGGTALAFLLFASNANRVAVCDALSPVWLSAMVAAGAGAVVMARISPAGWKARMLAAGVAGIAIGAAFALIWPHCLGRPEGVSPELEEMWLSRVREARPVYRHSAQVVAGMVSLPVAGLIGYALMLWRSRGDGPRLSAWGALALLALIAAALLLWQSRAGPAAQLFAIPGAAALGWILFAWARSFRFMLVQTAIIVAAFLAISGLAWQWPVNGLAKKPSRGMIAVNRANVRCPTLAALRPVALQPKGIVLTFVDLGPRLIAVTHHDAVAGPYHRNGAAILDVMRAFRGTAEAAHATVTRRGIDYVLICPNMSEATVYRSAAPNGFYVQLARGEVPGWLEPVKLPGGSPYLMWRVRR